MTTSSDIQQQIQHGYYRLLRTAYDNAEAHAEDILRYAGYVIGCTLDGRGVVMRRVQLISDLRSEAARSDDPAFAVAAKAILEGLESWPDKPFKRAINPAELQNDNQR